MIDDGLLLRARAVLDRRDARWDAEMRRERARKGGLTTAARGHVNTAPARAAMLANIPDRSAYFRGLAERSAAVRRERVVSRRRTTSQSVEDPYLRLAHCIAKGRRPWSVLPIARAWRATTDFDIDKALDR